MIILDDDQDQIPKLPDPTYAPPVNRCSTPTSTSSLPDYDTSEAQQYSKFWLRRPKSKYWKIVVVICIVYTLLTVVIGVPLMVIKLRNSRRAYGSTPWNPQQASVIVIPGQEIISSPPTYEEAMDCDQWFTEDARDHGLFTSVATYSMPLDIGIFLGSNGSYRADASSHSISGSLLVDINRDSTVSDIQIGVKMSYSTVDIRNRTHVCLVDAFDNNGFYIYVPDNLTPSDTLSFDISMLFPQQSLNISSFAVMLPLFQQRYAALSPKISFTQAVLGGPMSNVTVDSIKANKLFVMSSPGSISGTFISSEQLVLETMSAVVTANITMQLSSSVSQPSIRINTGNKAVTANVFLDASQAKWSGRWEKPPEVLIDVNTFNAPLFVSVAQWTSSSKTPLPVFVHAGNNLGLTSVYMDSNYEGTFLAQTEYASAVVGDSPDPQSSPMSNLTSSSAYEATSMRDAAGRTLYYDDLDGSSVSGWVGRGTRPKVITTAGAPGCVEVISVLSPVNLNLDATLVGS